MGDTNLQEMLLGEMDWDNADGPRGDYSQTKDQEGGVQAGEAQSTEDMMAADEKLARQLAAEDFPPSSGLRSLDDDLSMTSSNDDDDDESLRPHTEYFPRPGKTPLVVSWDESATEQDIPTDFNNRAAMRKIVAQVAIERGHEVAWIMKCVIRYRGCNSTLYGNSEQRVLFYAEHMEVEFGYRPDENQALDPDSMPCESAVIYFGPDTAEHLEDIGLWRKSGGPPVVWNQDAMLKLGRPRKV